MSGHGYESTYGLGGVIREGSEDREDDDPPPQRCKEPGCSIHVRRANRKAGYCERHKTDAENRHLETQRRRRVERRMAAIAAKKQSNASPNDDAIDPKK